MSMFSILSLRGAQRRGNPATLNAKTLDRRAALAMTFSKIKSVVILLIFCSSAIAAEQEEKQKPQKKTAKADSAIVTLQSTITGNREQPKVLYIVPWQAPDGPESLRQGFQSDLDELFQPVERNEFLRQLKNRGVPLTTAPQKDK
ncbi:hypothetical protein QSV34_12860 [Porticoccus sp. W117]|nr:hypothetical protein [Porticoccus sp. W117]